MEAIPAEAPAPSQTEEPPFKSSLPTGPQRFLAHAIEHALTCRRRTSQDFIRHFPPAIIMEGLEDEPQLRANIMVTATGVRMKVALKKTASSCGGDLQIALDEHETDADTVVALFRPDDRVRFLDNRSLWNFLIEGDFWLVDPKKDGRAHATAAEHISYLIERALDDQLLTHRDVVQGITVESMTNYLPRSELPKIIEAALALGQAKTPFVERDLLKAIGISKLAAHIPLASIWTQVVVPYVAEAHGFAKKPEAAAAPARTATPEPAAAQPAAAQPAAAQPAAVQPGASNARGAVAQPKPARAPLPAGRPAATSAQPPQAAGIASVLGEDDAGLDLEVDELLGSLPGGKEAGKRAGRRPGSIPPTA